MDTAFYEFSKVEITIFSEHVYNLFPVTNTAIVRVV